MLLYSSIDGLPILEAIDSQGGTRSLVPVDLANIVGVEGWDTVRETVAVAAAPDVATAAAAPAIPRDALGTPLEVSLGAWRSGDFLRVDWAASAFAVPLSPGASGTLVPRVLVGANPPAFVDNGSQIGLVGVPGTLVYAFGSCLVPIVTSDVVRVQLGIMLLQGAPGDGLSLPGGPMLVSAGVVASTWLRAARVPAGNVLSAPPAALTPLPIPIV